MCTSRGSNVHGSVDEDSIAAAVAVDVADLGMTHLGDVIDLGRERVAPLDLDAEAAGLVGERAVADHRVADGDERVWFGAAVGVLDAARQLDHALHLDDEIVLRT